MNTQKTIGVIFDEMHPLLESVGQHVEKLGHKVHFAHWKELQVPLIQDQTKGPVDLWFLDRMGEQTRGYFTQLKLMQFLEAPVVNTPQSYIRARDKALIAQHCVFKGISHPETRMSFSLEASRAIAESLGSSQIVKSTTGVCAEEVLSYEKGCLPDEFIARVLARDGLVLHQEFVGNGQFIWRIDVVNGKIIVANKRFTFQKGKLPLCNGTQGGDIVFFNPDLLNDALTNFVHEIVSAFELSICGVDIVEDEGGRFWLLEVNPEPDITLNRYEFPQAIADFLVSASSLNTPKQGVRS